MKKQNIWILVLIGVIGIAAYKLLTKKGSVYISPLDKGEYVPDVVDTTPPDYMDV
jgi:hypothetical protein